MKVHPVNTVGQKAFIWYEYQGFIREANSKGVLFLKFLNLYPKTLFEIIRTNSSVDVRDYLAPSFFQFFNRTKINDLDEFGQSPLSLAVKLQNFKITKLLVLQGAEINFADTAHQRTPLFYAVLASQSEIVQLLIHENCILNAQDRLGLTPLMIASSMGNLQIIQILAKSNQYLLVDTQACIC
jgi:hypothetical protein